MGFNIGKLSFGEGKHKAAKAQDAKDMQFKFKLSPELEAKLREQGLDSKILTEAQLNSVMDENVKLSSSGNRYTGIATFGDKNKSGSIFGAATYMFPTDADKANKTAVITSLRYTVGSEEYNFDDQGMNATVDNGEMGFFKSTSTDAIDVDEKSE